MVQRISVSNGTIMSFEFLENLPPEILIDQDYTSPVQNLQDLTVCWCSWNSLLLHVDASRWSFRSRKMAPVPLAITSMFKVVYALSLVLNLIEIIYILSSSKNRKSFMRNPQLLMLNLAFADFTFGLGGTGKMFLFCHSKLTLLTHLRLSSQTKDIHLCLARKIRT